MPRQVARYRVTFLRERRYRLHERVPLLMARWFLPPEGLGWIGSDLDVLQALLSVLGNDPEGAGVLGELVRQADGHSVAADLSGGIATRLPTAQARPLAERLLTALRHLLGEGALPLNRPGAAGWFTGDTLWLVSKRMLDALREHLAREGQTGIPSRNDRLMDELQQHGLVVPNGDRAIWNARITDGEWSHELTVLRFAAQVVWPDPTARPPVFAGAVSPVETPLQSGPAALAAPDADSADTPGIASTSGVADSNARTSGRSQRTPDCKPHEPPDTEPTADDAAPGEESPVDLGDRFLAWLREGVASGRLVLNARNARVHVTTEGLLLVSPAIFKEFDLVRWAEAQKRFQKRRLHRKTDSGTNIWSFAVAGERKRSVVKGLLIPSPEIAPGAAPARPQPASLPDRADLGDRGRRAQHRCSIIACDPLWSSCRPSC